MYFFGIHTGCHTMQERRQLAECFLRTVDISGRPTPNSFSQKDPCKRENALSCANNNVVNCPCAVKTCPPFLQRCYLNGFGFSIFEIFQIFQISNLLFRPLPVLLSPRDRFFRDRREKLSRSSWSFCELGPNATFFPG